MAFHALRGSLLAISETAAPATVPVPLSPPFAKEAAKSEVRSEAMSRGG